MAISVKPISEVVNNWANVTPGRSEVYSRNAQAASGTWLANFVAGIPNFQSAVVAAGVATRMANSARARGQTRYQTKIQAVGAARFGQGVTASREIYASAVQPYLNTISGLTLPPRRPRGDPSNLQRVQAIATALHNQRVTSAASG